MRAYKAAIQLTEGKPDLFVVYQPSFKYDGYIYERYIYEGKYYLVS